VYRACFNLTGRLNVFAKEIPFRLSLLATPFCRELYCSHRTVASKTCNADMGARGFVEHTFTASQLILFAELLPSEVSFSHSGFEFIQIPHLYGVAERQCNIYFL
jgi:hypothetical protein